MPHIYAGCPKHPARLSAMRDCYRVLLVFAPGSSDPQFRQQVDQLRADAAGFRERDLLFVPLLDGRGTHVSVPAIEGLPLSLLSVRGEDSARERFGTGGSFAVVLLGKDGGEKLRRDRPIAPEELYSIIDSMPMREQEMNERRRQQR